jgi:hypothetical protein
MKDDDKEKELEKKKRQENRKKLIELKRKFGGKKKSTEKINMKKLSEIFYDATFSKRMYRIAFNELRIMHYKNTPMGSKDRTYVKRAKILGLL